MSPLSEKRFVPQRDDALKNWAAKDQKSLFLQKVPSWLHYANLDGIFHIVSITFGGKNLKNKSYRMPFIVKKCKLFHF